MASVSYFLRSKIKGKDQPIWIRFRDKEIDIKSSIPRLKCSLEDWHKDGRCKNPNKKMFPNDEASINVELSKLSSTVLECYSKEHPTTNINGWLKQIIIGEYAQTTSSSKHSDDVIGFVDAYTDIKRNSLTESSIKKNNTNKNLIQRYYNDRLSQGKSYSELKFKDLDNYFKSDFERYCREENYKTSTINRCLKFIKTLSTFAESYDIEVHPHTKNWKNLSEKDDHSSPSIYLGLDELKKIQHTPLPNNYLDNARDWLIVSCFTGQRVSDFLHFTSQKLTKESKGDMKYLEFIQQKTNKRMKIPILSKVQEVLDKRDGDFPRHISDVKYNQYIKEVCRIAGIDEMIYGGKSVAIDDLKSRNSRRKVFGEFPKHELVTSHIGRRSLATNFYGKIPTTDLMYFTGHSTEQMFLQYIKKTPLEKAKSVAEQFKNLGY